jgi:choline dehydrogenase
MSVVSLTYSVLGYILTEEVLAGKEVILCAGAIDTPKLLLQSGVGDKAELDELGIKSVHDLPGVGKGLEDHVYAHATWHERIDDDSWNAIYRDPEAVQRARKQFDENGTGPLSSYHDTSP